MILSPFASALCEELQLAAPLVREHLAPGPGVHCYRGIMKAVWRASGARRWLTAPFLWIGARVHTLFPETGAQVSFEIVNRLFPGPDGAARMTFERAFSFPNAERRFEATMRYDTRKKVILDSLGRGGFLLVELHPTLDQNAITIRSGRQWILLPGLPLRIRLPRLLAGEAMIREWQENETQLGIRVVISNAVFGEFFGYEGTFERVDHAPENGWPTVAQETPHSLSHAGRIQLASLAFAGTAAYASSCRFLRDSEAALGSATRIGVVAGLSWLGFGLALLVARPGAGLWAWVDTCLRTMARGIGVLTPGILVDLVAALDRASARAPWLVGIHLVLLLVSDCVMGAYFVRSAGIHGLTVPRSLLLWVVVLNGLFAAGMLLS